jgi:DNA-binding NtrC family response regulator
VEIQLPALRERRGDVPLLANAFLREFARENNKPIQEISREAMDLLLNYSWPGNVRELRAAIEGGVVLCRGPKITPRDLPESVQHGDAVSVGQPAETVHEAEKQLIMRALKEAEGNRTLAAKRIGMSRRTLHRKLHEYQLENL